MIRKYTIRKGTENSWNREVGYGTAPEWYLKDFDIEINVCDPPDINKLVRERNE